MCQKKDENQRLERIKGVSVNIMEINKYNNGMKM